MLPKHVVKLIEETTQELGLKKWEYYIEPGSKKGDNYIGLIYRVIVTGLNFKGATVKLSLIAKLAPENEIRREKYQVEDCFAREKLTYESVLPEMTKIQKQQNISSDDRFISDMKCYRISTEKGKECILMEDITTKGYQMWDRNKPLDLDHAVLAMQQLGKFHAISFALKDQKPELFKKFSNLEDVVFSNEEYFTDLIPYFNLFIDKAIDTLDDNEIGARDKMQEFKKHFMKIMFDGVKASLAEPYAVVCHGDCWTNNMMFKYENGKPSSLILLDWQITRYSSPVTDITYMLFCCTDKYLRDQHYENLMRIYHKSLCSHLEALGSDSNKLFTYEALQEQLKTFSKYSLGMAIYDLPNMIANAEDIKDLDEMAESLDNNDTLTMESFDSLNEKTEPLYKARMHDVIIDCIKFNYL
ncbi:uncharacterized protein LOC113376659 [Ctenocephalides felis]|uniref:uncharacterized protein LOC113376659 n=1 Tax=Ctenocephalides felis TaxID=7515 RepID=UPI000E6E30AB|nr:uncharacterized protein LOC113376659 [Ctenocephalides felis]